MDEGAGALAPGGPGPARNWNRDPGFKKLRNSETGRLRPWISYQQISSHAGDGGGCILNP